MRQPSSAFLPGFEALYGNSELKAYFSSAIGSRTLSHAYLLEGKRGSGRHTLSFAAAYAMALFEKAEAGCAHRVAARCSPDVRVFGVPEKKKTVGVDTVRLLKAETFLRPSELPFRVFLLEDADLMTVAAQNAALKLLEEPPAGVYFFLLAESAESLLETVRSRVTAVRMERFSEEALTAYLSSGHPSLPKGIPGDRGKERAAVSHADGRIGELLAALTAPPPKKSGKKEAAGSASAYGAAAALLAAVGKKGTSETHPSRSILPAVLSLPGSGEGGRETLSSVLQTAEGMVRDILLVRTDAELPLLVFSSPEEAREAGRSLSMAGLLALEDALRGARMRLAAGEGLTLLRSTLADSLKRAAAL